MVEVAHTTANHQFFLSMTAGGLVRAQTRNGLTGFSDSTGGSTIATGTWYQVGGIWRSGNNWRNAYVNGSAGTANTNTRSVTISGQRGNVLFTNAANAEIADLTVWNVDIGSDGMLQHAAGFSGRFIRPESVVFHAPFVRSENEFKSNITITENGTLTETTHPPIIGAIAS
jgi:hypothetical protein